MAHARKFCSWETETGELSLVHYQFGILAFDKERKGFSFEGWIRGCPFYYPLWVTCGGDMAYSYIFVDY